jgi:hypothetical protein
VAEEKRLNLGQKKIFVTEVHNEPGQVIKQISDTLSKDTALVESSDFVLIANQKNRGRRPKSESE